MKRFSVQIVGDTSLLQHRFGEDAEANSGKATRRVNLTEETPREAAAKVAYKDAKGEFYFPGAAIGRLLREAGAAHKQKGSRKSVKFLVPAAVLVLDDAVTILNGDGKTPVKDFEVDSRPVVIPATKGRVMRHRPRFDKWSARFQIRINETVAEPGSARRGWDRQGKAWILSNLEPVSPDCSWSPCARVARLCLAWRPWDPMRRSARLSTR